MRTATLLSLLSVFSFASASNAQLVFNFTATQNTPQNVIDGFVEAGQLWSNVITDSVTVDINIDFAALTGGQIGATETAVGFELYSDFTAALGADVTSAADASSFANLQTGASFSVLSNLSAENPNGAGSTTPYFDTIASAGSSNNLAILYTSANARAIGIDTGVIPGGDGSITFSSNSPWDFDRSDGISGLAFDFVGTAAHEIGHVLGFTSGVDNIDATPGGSEDDFEFFSNPLDLFRFSAQSLAQGAGVPDMTASGLPKYFSVDGGATSLANYSLGINFGDGFQASHWKDGLGIGMMDPATNLGEMLNISQLDLTAFDVIGWDIAPVPEPGSMVLLMFGITGIALRRSRRFSRQI